MKIYIPTYKRVDTQVTINNIPDELKSLTYLVARKEERDQLIRHHKQIIVLPDYVNNIGTTRQYIVDTVKDKTILFLDDDLNFFKREDDTKKLRKCNKEQFIELYKWFIEKIDQGYPMVGLSSRQGNNHHIQNEIQLSRIMTVYALNIDILKTFNIRFDEMELMEDFNVALRLIRNGFLTISNAQFAHGQGSSNMKGGCSEYRNNERQSKCARMLVRNHAPFVRLVKKKTKSWKGMEEREDVMIYWKKAYQDYVKKNS
tara:strand:+ start:158 stop:931 length:774 start_codon:yes stop_codon:yes gene_type:complete